MNGTKRECQGCNRTEEKRVEGNTIRWVAITLDRNGKCRACREAEAEFDYDVNNDPRD